MMGSQYSSICMPIVAKAEKLMDIVAPPVLYGSESGVANVRKGEERK